ncbi:hypothetical protein STEG23_032571 [Scotinomys teguina]
MVWRLVEESKFNVNEEDEGKRCPSREKWITKMWYIHTMEYYAAEKNNDIMKFAGKWMELENVILIEQDIPENTEEGGVDDLLTSSEQYENLESQEDMSEELK